mmetsp:Transcript_8446/g.14165  ORF Transcript_8446/g.14165 Transcript_8446/m.14165 type:complete len:207 (+) Transcript_8446:602-1222(+)
MLLAESDFWNRPASMQPPPPRIPHFLAPPMASMFFCTWLEVTSIMLRKGTSPQPFTISCWKAWAVLQAQTTKSTSERARFLDIFSRTGPQSSPVPKMAWFLLGTLGLSSTTVWMCSWSSLAPYISAVLLRMHWRKLIVASGPKPPNMPHDRSIFACCELAWKMPLDMEVLKPTLLKGQVTPRLTIRSCWLAVRLIALIPWCMIYCL